VSLRARLALALALLAAAAVIAVAVTGYASTSRGLHQEVDRSLTGYGQRLADPDGNLARGLCDQLTHDGGRGGGGPNGGSGQSGGGGPSGGGGTAREPGSLIPELPSTSVQCVKDGQVLRGSSHPDIPVDRTDLQLAASGGHIRLRTQTVKGSTYRVMTVPVGTGFAVQLARDLAETNRVLDSLRNRYVLIGVSVIALAALAGWLIARRTARPLVRLTRSAERIAETGRLEADVPTTGRDETGRLARAFVTMLDALTRSRDQQQRLAQDAGHELRTPLTSLRTNIDTLRRHRDLPDDTRDRVLDDLDIESTELNTLVDELVALVTEQHDDEPERSVALDQLVRRAVDRARRRTGRTITVETEPTRVLGRPRQLHRAVGNLLDNAAKFSPDHVPIEVTVADGSIRVSDHGPGIAPQDLPHIFDRFYRADTARSLPGSGLGLAIVHHVAHEHGGAVHATNAAEGGAMLTLTIPILERSSTPAEVPPS
jgi:two-component system, OmpR family, sensor histidine kinase MprB